ncbi:MAG: hypothetical protein GF388_05250 [Candidatus Aegiribacteria sp.]|nr:hypothetical protein [Candidatus Aegiribacteria sp.]MBD3294616.1 hypothetical protein [Candidatus Fermentibacteria bacterium]
MRRRIRYRTNSRKKIWRNLPGPGGTQASIEPKTGACTVLREQPDRSRGLKAKHEAYLPVLLILIAVLVAGIAGLTGCGNTFFFLIPATISVKGVKVMKDDPLFPSEGVIRNAGLELNGSGELDLPEQFSVEYSGGKARQLLHGKRYGREVRSGIRTLCDGRLMVRTGVSSRPPSFRCEVRNGNLFSHNTPSGISQALASRRAGPGNVLVTNGENWLLVERILPASGDRGNTWLLLRQLRDIYLAENLAGSVATSE